MSGKFTPGPWHRDYAGNGNVWAANCKVADTSNPIQEWRYRDVPDEERGANANLIAAAPDLLASLIELLEPLERASAALVAEGKALNQNGEAAFDRARAAIAKATGAA